MQTQIRVWRLTIWDALPRIWIGLASDSERPPSPGFRGRRGIEHQAGPSHVRLESRRWSVPANCGLSRGCR